MKYGSYKLGTGSKWNINVGESAKSTELDVP